MDLRHGIFLAPFHALDENPTLCFERDLELLAMLDDLGFSEAWIGEHHSAGMETIDSPELFIAAAAERTKHLRFGTGVVLLGDDALSDYFDARIGVEPQALG